MSAYFGSVGHPLSGNGSSNYYECVSVSGTTYLYKRPNKPANHGSEIKFVADSTSGTGRYTGTWQDASSVAMPNAFGIDQNQTSTPSYVPTHANTTLFCYNNENCDVILTVSYSTSSMGLSSVNSGTATQNLDGSLSFIVSAGSSSSETYSISLDGSDKATITPPGS
jgi:hypothetical protein